MLVNTLNIQSGFNRLEEVFYNFNACHPRYVNAIFNNQPFYTQHCIIVIRKLHVSAVRETIIRFHALEIYKKGNHIYILFIFMYFLT